MDAESGRAVVNVLACVLQKLVTGNDKTERSARVTKFHALRPPTISVKDYLERICKYASCSAECFVLALVYIDRLIQQAEFVVSSLNIHRVVITSVMLAAKFFDDHYYNNAYYAKIGGVPCSEMNSLELEFLFLINFTLYVEPESYTKYYGELCNHAFMTTLPLPDFAASSSAAAAVVTGGSQKRPDSALGGGDEAMDVDTDTSTAMVQS